MLATMHTVLHHSLPLFTWELPASQPGHFKILKGAQGPSRSTLRCIAMQSSIQLMTEVIQGVIL